MTDLKIEVATKEKFSPLFQKHSKEIFANDSFFNPENAFNKQEQSQIPKLKENMGHPLRINLLAYYKGDFAGWSWGF